MYHSSEQPGGESKLTPEFYKNHDAVITAMGSLTDWTYEGRTYTAERTRQWIEEYITDPNSKITKAQIGLFPLDPEVIKVIVSLREGLMTHEQEVASKAWSISNVPEAEIVEDVNEKRFVNLSTAREVLAEIQRQPIPFVDQFGNKRLFTADLLKEGYMKAKATEFADLTGFTKNEGLRDKMRELLIVEAKTITELCNLVSQFSEIRGSMETLTGTALAERIKALAQYTNGNFETVTNTYGIRSAAERIFKNS